MASSLDFYSEDYKCPNCGRIQSFEFVKDGNNSWEPVGCQHCENCDEEFSEDFDDEGWEEVK